MKEQGDVQREKGLRSPGGPGSGRSARAVCQRLWWVCLAGLWLLCGGCSSLYTAERIQLMKTEGQVGVVSGRGREVTPVPEMKLYSGYQVATEKASFAWLNLDSVKLAKMDEDSQISVSKRRKGMEVEVASGSLYFHIKEPLKEDETLDIRTSNMAVGIRGTCGWVEVADPQHMKVYILEGTVTCTVRDPQTREKTEAAVSAGEMAELSLDPEAEEGEVCQIRTDRFLKEDIAAFVLQELLEDGALCSAVKEASGLDVLKMAPPSEGDGAAEDEAGPEDDLAGEPAVASGADLYEDYIRDVLEPQYGRGDVTSFSYGFERIDSGWDDYWYARPTTAPLPDGIVGTCQRDLDKDGTDELLLFYVEGSEGSGAGHNNLGLKVYSEKDGFVTEMGGMRFEDCFSQTNAEDYQIGLKDLGDHLLIYAAGNSSVYTFADGEAPEIRLYRYDGSAVNELYRVSNAGSDGSWWSEWEQDLHGFGFVLPSGAQWGDIGLTGEPDFEMLFYGSCETVDNGYFQAGDTQRFLLEQGQVRGGIYGPGSPVLEQLP